MSKLRKTLSAVFGAIMTAAAIAVPAMADDGTQYGVTTSTTTSYTEKTITMTSASKENTSGGSWFYIGEVAVTSELEDVTIDIGAGTGGSNVTGGAKQAFSDETTGTISGTDYNTLFNAKAFVAYSSTTDARSDLDVTSAVKAKADSEGNCYLYAWVNNGGCTITVTANYYTGTHGVTATETTSGNTKTITTVKTPTQTTSEEDWVYLGAVEVNDSLAKVTLTVPETGESNFAATATQLAWNDFDKGNVASTAYDAIFKTGLICNNNYDTTSTDLCGTTQDVTSALTTAVSSGTAYIYGWLKDASQAVTVTAVYIDGDEAEFEAADWGSTNSDYTADGNKLTYTDGTSFYGYKAEMYLNDAVTVVNVVDSDNNVKGTYEVDSLNGNTMFYIITDKEATGLKAAFAAGDGE